MMLSPPMISNPYPLFVRNQSLAKLHSNRRYHRHYVHSIANCVTSNSKTSPNTMNTPTRMHTITKLVSRTCRLVSASSQRMRWTSERKRSVNVKRRNFERLRQQMGSRCPNQRPFHVHRWHWRLQLTPTLHPRAWKLIQNL